MAITFTQSDLDALKEALISGAEEVQIGDRKIRYKTQKDLLAAIKIVQSFLDGTPTTSPNVIPTTFSKGKQ